MLTIAAIIFSLLLMWRGIQKNNWIYFWFGVLLISIYATDWA